MRIPIDPRFPISDATPNTRRQVILSLLAAACLMAGAQVLAAQDAAAPAPPPSRKVVHRSHASATHNAVKSATPPPMAAVVAAAPPDPHWPANDKPNQASVTWDSQGLRIDASNSSLHEILNEVSTLTGAKVEGMGPDERVFGAFGPGMAREVVSQLLHGSNYNVLMIGDQGQGAPRQIVLSSRTPGMPQDRNAQSNPSDSSDDDVDADQDDQPQALPGRPNFGPGMPPRTPQQMMQEMQQRQQEMLRQQQTNQQPH